MYCPIRYNDPAPGKTAAGMTGYLSKPLKLEALREALEAHLSNLAGAR